MRPLVLNDQFKVYFIIIFTSFFKDFATEFTQIQSRTLCDLEQHRRSWMHLQDSLLWKNWTNFQLIENIPRWREGNHKIGSQIVNSPHYVKPSHFLFSTDCKKRFRQHGGERMRFGWKKWWNGVPHLFHGWRSWQEKSEYKIDCHFDKQSN